ncbi:hypothetical protein I6N95_15145 [Vagococcus sp. BWB3-3]|uniref:C-deglycosylation enzyme beta subunit n=1 Tax=Vagococcus allomyrinae TaxID=2794353 RepID=A0A940PCM5_9ENTE|nr:DUF6379 domain-containing protein [Vagococcus allomyrinae]MBP1042355.1 hypothetical protein [Vagococcus allomyrinae]
MFEKYLVNPTGFRNVEKDGEVIGYEVQLRIPYYRGLAMSCVEVIDLTVDEESVSNQAMLITVKGETFTFAELPTAINHRWEMIETITVFVNQPGGLQAGEHKVHAFVSLRISYLPFNNTGEDEKVLVLEG